MRFIVFIFLMALPASGDYIRSGTAFSSYVDFAVTKAQEAVAIDHPAQQVGYTQSCSGVLLDPWTVLTAGHCVTDTNLKLLPNPNLYTISYGINKNNPTFVATGQSVILHPNYGNASNGGRVYDLALIILSTPLYDVLQYGNLGTVSPKIGDVLTGFGYGIKGNSAVGVINPNNPNLNPDSPYLSAYQSIVDRVGITNPPYMFEMQFSQALQYGGNAAPGDSGGGIENANGDIVGITSTIDSVSNSQMPQHTQAMDVTQPALQNFIKSNWVTTSSANFTGTGNVSTAANWQGGQLPQNGSYHYYISNVTKSMTIDKTWNVDGVQMNNANATFTVNQGQTANFLSGLDLTYGSAKINGSYQGKFLRVSNGSTYTSPSKITVTGNGYLLLQNGGNVATKQFNMTGGHISGNGTITASSGFAHTNGVISPSNLNLAGTLNIKGTYQQSTANPVVWIRLFNDKSSDLLAVTQNSSSNLNFYLDFPDKILPPNTSFTLLSASTPGTKTTPSIYINNLYKAGGKYAWVNNNLVLTITSLGLPNQTVADITPTVYNSLHGLLTSGATVPSSVFEKIRDMSHEQFVQSLGSFSNPHVQTVFHKTLGNKGIQTMQRNERAGLFLEKKRDALDLKSFAVNGNVSFLGGDVLVPQNEGSPLSLYISGELDQMGSKYSTDGLTFGWDYAEGRNLTGFGIHFKNRPSAGTLYSSQETQDYHIDFYQVHRGSDYFFDYALGAGSYQKDIRFDDIWGNWKSSAQAHDLTTDVRLGLYSRDAFHFFSGYVGVSSMYSHILPFITTVEGLSVYTTQSVLGSLDAKIGFESKFRFHVENHVFEPFLQVAVGLPLYQMYKAPSNSFSGGENSFNYDSFALDKTSLFMNFTLRAYAFKNSILKLELEGVKQWEEFNSKILLGIDVRF